MTGIRVPSSARSGRNSSKTTPSQHSPSAKRLSARPALKGSFKCGHKRKKSNAYWNLDKECRAGGYWKCRKCAYAKLLKYQQARIRLFHQLLGGRCIQCGTTKRLEIDHIDPRTKMFDLSARCRNTLKPLLHELRKCQLLCVPHHKAKTWQDRNRYPDFYKKAA